MKADLKIDRGTLYHIDSIRIFGNVNINKSFLHQYLNIPPNSLYNRRRLTEVDKRILELPFLSSKQPSDVTMLGTGGILNLYLQPKKNSQFNFIVGFLPASSGTGKLQITGDVNLDLKNLLGGGERLFFKWQQLQPQSPRLNIGFNKPYVFNSPLGVDGLFDLFKKDSNFLQINAKLGLQYLGTGTQSGKVFIQWQNTGLLQGAIDTNQVKLTKSLPLNIDVSAVNMGIDYAFNNTNYRFNPIRGTDIALNISVGIKNVKKNNDIVSIKDPAFNFSKLYDSINSKNYQIRLRLNAAHYFPLGKASVIKASFNGGFYGSPVIFRNELFQIGGYSLLRGFDEEGIYATNFGVLSAEYRMLLGINAYLGFFVDAGMVNKRYQRVNLNNTFAGLGTALLYETKSGMLNVSFAIGRQDNSKFDLRQATKLHFGYINYF
ncbi:MAG: hypothetical protein FGM46_10455 [Ferruginibacter sp.]|nr:hypothetical protein [Ferruginibacter sp.]